MWPFGKKVTITIVERGDKPVNAIKFIRGVTGWGLRDAKLLIDGAPNTSIEGLSMTKAEFIREKLEEASPGAIVKIR